MAPRTLCDLPNELLSVVVDSLSRHELCSASRVCTRLRALAEPLIYKDLLIKNGAMAVCVARAISSSPSRAAVTRSLRVANRTISEDGQYESLVRLLPLLGSLQELKVESPPTSLSNDDEIQRWLALQRSFGVSFAQAASDTGNLLSSLRSCTIHLLGDGGRQLVARLSTLEKIAGIFLHPHLQALTVSRAWVDDEAALRRFFPESLALQSTPLTSLSLEQCDISDSGLAFLLTLPRALKSLDISETKHYGPVFYGPLTSERLLSALSVQKDHLESLALEQLPDHSPLDLTSFPSIRHLEFGGSATRLLSDHSLFHRFSTSLPPRLQSLQFGYRYVGRRPEVSQIQPCIRHLLGEKTVHTLADWNKVTVCVGEPEGTVAKLAHAHERFGDECAKAGVRLVAVGVTRTPGFVPPYFFGEPWPVEKVLYDSGVK